MRRFAVSIAFGLVLGCNQPVGQPIVYPHRAYLGETISVAIDTDHSPVQGRNYTLSGDNVRIQITDTVTNATATLVPRAIVLGANPLNTPLGEQQGTTEVSIAVFDLPTELPPDPSTDPATPFSALPTTVTVFAVFHPDLTVINPQMYPTLEILGPAEEGQGPTTFFPSPPDFAPPPIEVALEPLPALRVAAKTLKFPSTWSIGSIQFDVVYNTALVGNPRAYAKTMVAKAYARAVDVSPGRARAMLVDPQGLELRASAARGPFVDIVFDKTAPFETADFSIEDLLVSDVDGNVLVDMRTGTDLSSTYFTLYARANQ
jgi:hypothetical protein